MSQKTITVGTSGAPASLDTNFGNAQDNFTELYARSDTTSGVVTSPLTASGSIGGSRVICDTSGLATYADSSDITTAHNIRGISSNAAADGDAVTVVTAGAITEVSWAWTPKQPVYVSTAGTLTQTPPSTGYIRKIGFAESSTTIVVQDSQPIILGA